MLRREALERGAVALVLAVPALFALRQVASPDIGFHLKAGRFILSGQGWPRTDAFTFTVSDHPYIDTSWGYQALLSTVESALGSAGMVALTVLLALVSFALIAATARLVRGEVCVLLPLLLLGGLAAEPRFEVRPEMASYALLALLLYLLHRHAERRDVPLWTLPAIFVVWTNSHSLFVLGWAAVGCFVVGSWMRERRPDLPLCGWSAAALVVSFVNPYGWRSLTFPFELATRMRQENVFAQNIGEFYSPLHYLRSDQLTFYLIPVLCYFAFALLVLVSLPSLWRGRRYAAVLLGLVFVPLSLTMIRNVPPMVVACLPGAAVGLSLDRALERIRLSGSLRHRVRQGLLVASLSVACILGVRIYTDAYYVSARRSERFGVGWNALALPIDAARFAERAEFRGNVLNHLNFGAYLMWSLERPVFIDGRLEVMGEEFYEQYRSALASPAGLEAAVRRYDIGWVVFPYRLRPDLLEGLSRSPVWRPVYFDHLSAIFARRDESALAHESVREVERGPVHSPDLSTLPGLGGPARSRGAKRWLSGLFRRQHYPTVAFSRGVLQFSRRDAQRAAEAFATAIEASDGRYYEIYNNLGSSLFALGRLAEARDCYRIYLSELPLYRAQPRLRVRKRLEEIERRLVP